MRHPSLPVDARRIVSAYLAVVEALTSADVYPPSLRDLPYSKAVIQAAFKTSIEALLSVGQLATELGEYLEIAYVALADYREDAEARLLRDYRRAGETLAPDQPLAPDKTRTAASGPVSEHSRLAAQCALAITTEAERRRGEFRAWLSRADAEPVPRIDFDGFANARDSLI